MCHSQPSLNVLSGLSETSVKSAPGIRDLSQSSVPPAPVARPILHYEAILRHAQKPLKTVKISAFEHVLERLLWTYRQVPGV